VDHEQQKSRKKVQNDDVKMKRYYFKCPKCGSDSDFRKVKEEPTDAAAILFLLGHFIIAILYGLFGDHWRRIQCAECGHIFRRPALRRSSVSKLSLTVVVLVLLFVCLAMLLAGLGGDVGWFGEYGVVSVVEGFVGRNASAVAISAILMVVCIVGVCLTVCVVSDSVLHRKIRQEYEIKPRRYSSAGDKGSVREENKD
jgi:hypothetical protein